RRVWFGARRAGDPIGDAPAAAACRRASAAATKVSRSREIRAGGAQPPGSRTRRQRPSARWLGTVEQPAVAAAADSPRQPTRARSPRGRAPMGRVLELGIGAINARLPAGGGQRLGLFAGPGVGKSILLGMMARYTSAEVIVVGLIGERGREVKEFVEQILGPQGRARSIVVATPADNPPLMRLHGAWRATAIAEYFR